MLFFESLMEFIHGLGNPGPENDNFAFTLGRASIDGLRLRESRQEYKNGDSQLRYFSPNERAHAFRPPSVLHRSYFYASFRRPQHLLELSFYSSGHGIVQSPS